MARHLSAFTARIGLVDLPQPTVQMTFEEVSPVDDALPVEIDLNNDNLGEFLSHFDFETDISDMVSVINVHENKVIFGMKSNYARYMSDDLIDELKNNFQLGLRGIYADESLVAEIVVINAPVEDEPAEPVVEEAEDLELPVTIGQVMSSVEIVKIINDMRDEGTAVLRHSDFLVKIKKVLGEDLATKFFGARIDSRGKEQPCYFLPKREAHLMVMSENYKVQAAVYDRMVELEGKLTGGNVEPKIEPKQNGSLLEKLMTNNAIIKEALFGLNMLGIEGNQAALGANKVAILATAKT